MNNNGFNGQIELPEELCEKTKDAVQAAVTKHNQVHRKRRTVLLSTAACLAVFAISIVSVKYFKQNQIAPSENPTSSGTGTHISDTPTANDEGIYLESNGNLPIPQSFTLNNKEYLQYSIGMSYEETKIKINQSDIGEMICELGAENLKEYSSHIYENWTDTIFLNAKVYRYTKAKSDSILIVQTTDGKYYLFSIDGVSGNSSITDLINDFSAGGVNEIIGIEIWQNTIVEFPDELGENGAPLVIGGKDSRPILKGTIKDKDTIQTILTILEKKHDKRNAADMPTDDNTKLMSDYGMYDIRIVFSDGQELDLPARDIDYTSDIHMPSGLLHDPSALDIHLRKGYFLIGEGDCYSINDSDYNELAAILEKYMS